MLIGLLMTGKMFPGYNQLQNSQSQWQSMWGKQYEADDPSSVEKIVHNSWEVWLLWRNRYAYTDFIKNWTDTVKYLSELAIPLAELKQSI